MKLMNVLPKRLWKNIKDDLRFIFIFENQFARSFRGDGGNDLE